MESIWDQVDKYFCTQLIPADAMLDASLAASDEAALPAIQVTAAQGKFLNLLVQMCGARRILEIGTLGGYSTIWMARALPPDGQLISLEIDARHAALARENLSRAGLQDRATVWTAPALDSLATLAAQAVAPFDLVFIDADKQNYPAYFDAVIDRMAPGGLIIADNVLWDGKVTEPAQEHDEKTAALVAYARKVYNDARVEQVMVPIRDGVLIARRK